MLTGGTGLVRERVFSWLMGVLVVAAAGVGTALADEDVGGVNAAVLAEAYRYQDGGGYVWENSTGSPRELVWEGEVVLRKQAEGTYCSGFTFAVMFDVAKQRGLFEGKTVAELKLLQRRWYGAVEDERTREVQAAVAMQKLGIGKQVHPRQAKAGDFLQFWRTRSGHAVVFLGWLEENGQRVGIRYRSTQRATGGIGDHEERFQAYGGHVDHQRCYFARLNEEKASEGNDA